MNYNKKILVFVLATILMVAALCGCTGSRHTAKVKPKPKIDILFVVDRSASFVKGLEAQRKKARNHYDNVMYAVATFGEDLESASLEVTTSVDDMVNDTVPDPHWKECSPFGETEELIGFFRKHFIKEEASTEQGTYFTCAFDRISEFADSHPDDIIVPVILSDLGVDDPYPYTGLRRSIEAASTHRNIRCIGALLATTKELKDAMVSWLAPFGKRAVVSTDDPKEFRKAIASMAGMLGLEY